jgi:hypothetical protein
MELHKKEGFRCQDIAMVGWVEPTPGFVGFLHLRRTNLHLYGANMKCETQQWPIPDPNPKSFLFDQTGRFFWPDAALV